MSMKVLPIGEARKRLPELVRKVAAGHPPIPIGRRGHCEAVLAPAAGPEVRVERRPLTGLVEILGSSIDLGPAQEAIRREIDTSLDRTARLISGKLPPGGRTRRRSRR